MDWNAVRDFLAVTRHGTLSAAGRALGVNASTVARRIETLEAELGVRLFQRARTGYVPTDEGRRLVERAERLEAAATAFVRRAEDDTAVTGTVRLATTENHANVLLLPSMGTFAATHPALSVEIVTDIRTANLDRRDADLALRLVRPTRGNVSLRRVGMQRYGLYGSAGYVARRTPADHPERFETDRFVVWSDRYADLPAARWTDTALGDRPPALVTSSLRSQHVAARAGLGLAVLPCFMGDADPCLRRIACDVDALEEALWLVVHTDLADSARVRAVADFVAGVVRDNADRLEGRHAGRHGDPS